MTTDRIDMSLEEIIKSNRKAATNSKTEGAGGRGRGRVGGGAARGQERGRGGPRSRSRGRIPAVTKSGRVGNFKSRSRWAESVHYVIKCFLTLSLFIRSRKRQDIEGGGGRGGGLRRVKSAGSLRRSR